MVITYSETDKMNNFRSLTRQTEKICGMKD